MARYNGIPFIVTVPTSKGTSRKVSSYVSLKSGNPSRLLCIDRVLHPRIWAGVSGHTVFRDNLFFRDHLVDMGISLAEVRLHWRYIPSMYRQHAGRGGLGQYV